MDKPFELARINTWIDPADDGSLGYMEITMTFRAFNQLIEWELHDYPFDSDEFYRMARESMMIFSRHDESSEIGIM